MARSEDPPGPRSARDAALLAELSKQLADETDPGRRLDLIDNVLRPPEPQLLDTCVLQNLDWVDRQVNAGMTTWDESAETRLVRRYGKSLAHDLLDLGILYRTFEDQSGYPWLVCNAAVAEAGLLNGPKGASVRNLIEFLGSHQRDWSSDAYPAVAHGLLLSSGPSRVSPLILRALSVRSVEEVHSPHGPLKLLPDRGDRLVAAHALLSNIPVVLTTDRRTFWARRGSLLELGLRVMRPGELLDLYEPYWKVLETEFARRRAKG